MSERETTYGDEYEVKCPACSQQTSTQDLTTDGCLTEGTTFECGKCHVEIEIINVDYSATVEVRVLDKYLDWCEMWGRIGRQNVYQINKATIKRE